MRLLLFLFFLLPFSFAQMDCMEFGRMCAENACIDSGGHLSGEECAHDSGAEFDFAYYGNATAECGLLRQQCEGTGGFLMPTRSAGCCGPVLVLLGALGFAARDSRFK